MRGDASNANSRPCSTDATRKSGQYLTASSDQNRSQFPGHRRISHRTLLRTLKRLRYFCGRCSHLRHGEVEAESDLQYSSGSTARRVERRTFKWLSIFIKANPPLPTRGRSTHGLSSE